MCAYARVFVRVHTFTRIHLYPYWQSEERVCVCVCACVHASVSQEEFEELQRVQTEFSGKYSIDDEEIAQVYLYLNIYVLNI